MIEAPDMERVFFKDGYRYQLIQSISVRTAIKPVAPGGNNFVRMDDDGLLTIERGYAWDGASGPAINTLTYRRASLVHDALYQLIREGVVSMADRNLADQYLHAIAVKDGMWLPRACWGYQTVNLLGAIWMANKRDEVLSAP